MRKFYPVKMLLGLVLVLGFALNTFAQISQGGTPKSWTVKNLTDNFDTRIYQKPDVDLLLAEDEHYTKDGSPMRFAKHIDVNLSIDNSGTWEYLPDGGRIWRLMLKTKEAYALQVLYDAFYVPVGAQFFVYNEDKTHLYGAFDHTNNPKQEEWATAFTEGDATVLEYYEPGRVLGKPIIEISRLSYAYKYVPFMAPNRATKIGESDPCEVDINCPEGANWQDEKKGVARISIVIGGGGYLCSGSLVNNTAGDCTPYFLSAYHCAEGASASDYNQWQFYFHYETATCGGSNYNSAILKVATGCTEKAKGTGSYGSGSDMLLLQLNNLPSSTAQSWGVYFNGWDRYNTGSPNGVGIHHPAGDVKKISTYTSTLVNYYGTHWQVGWVATETDHGVTEGGSSGSPIFNSTGNIVGTLTGGSSFCTATSGKDYYGKMSYHWTSNGGTAAAQCAPWLDPSSSGVTSLAGTYAPCATAGIVADFQASATTVVQGSQVTFTDLSTGSPTQWSWSFPGGAPTSATTQNPTVTYNTLGYFNVTLTAGDGTDSDVATKTNYIHVVEAGSSSCDSVSNFVGTYSLIGSTNGGYVSGTNGYGDLSKAEYFSGLGGTFTDIDKVYIKFGAASGTSTITINVRADNGGTPGSVIASATKSMTAIVADVNAGNWTEVDFTPDVVPSGAFYVEVVLPTNGDELGIMTNADGESAANTGWETWDNGAWYAYDNASAWGISLSHAIVVYACGTASSSPIANFTADQTNITTGQTVQFTDLSTGTITSRNWVFAGGTPGTSTATNPTVTYNTAGTYNVSLTVSDGTTPDTHTKTAYIVVSDPSTTCDTLINIGDLENYVLYTFGASAWGYWTGHNEYNIAEFAEYFSGVTGNQVEGVFAAVGSADDMSGSGNVTFKVYGTGATPGTVLGTKDVAINTMVAGGWNYIPFDNPVAIGTSDFYVGYEVYYTTPIDTFTVYCAESRGTGGANTAWLSYGGWSDFSTLSSGSLTTALALMPVVCPTGVGLNSPELEAEVKIFPNPTSGDLNVYFGSLNTDNTTLSVYNMFGSLVKVFDSSEIFSNMVSFNMGDLNSGVYLVEVQNDYGKLVKRIVLTR